MVHHSNFRRYCTAAAEVVRKQRYQQHVLLVKMLLHYPLVVSLHRRTRMSSGAPAYRLYSNYHDHRNTRTGNHFLQRHSYRPTTIWNRNSNNNNNNNAALAIQHYSTSRCCKMPSQQQHDENSIQEENDEELIPTITIAKPNIDTMSSKDMKRELHQYGINTDSMFEKQDFVIALQKLRSDSEDGTILPMMNAISAMQYEIKLYHNNDKTNMDQYLERKEIENEFLQICPTIQSNMETIVFHDDTTISSSFSSSSSSSSSSILSSAKAKTTSTGATATNTQHEKVGIDGDDDPIKQQQQQQGASHDHNHHTEEDLDYVSNQLFYKELIYDEMKNVCDQLSIQEMHKVLEQELFVSPYQLLYKCIVLARIDGIVYKTIRNNTNSNNNRKNMSNNNNNNDASIIRTQQQRVFPTYLWKSFKVQDIVIDAYLNPNDERKKLLLSLSTSEKIHSQFGSTSSATEHSSSSSSSSSTGNNNNNNNNNNISRAVRIQNEMKKLDPMISMKTLYKELEDVWGISPRCIYICTIAVLRILDVVREEKANEMKRQQQEMFEQPHVQKVVKEAMLNPKIDSILSQAIEQPSIRNLIVEYIHDPKAFISNQNNAMNQSPEIQKIFNHPDWMEQIQQMDLISKLHDVDPNSLDNIRLDDDDNDDDDDENQNEMEDRSQDDDEEQNNSTATTSKTTGTTTRASSTNK